MKRNWEEDAREFGLHVRQGGWRLGLLVARNVEPGKGEGGTGSNQHSRRAAVAITTAAGKVSARAFAAKSGQSADRVLRYREAWERAAAEGLVPRAADLTPGEEPDLDMEKLPGWDGFYDATAGPNRISDDSERGRAVRQEAVRAGVSVHKTDEASRNHGAVVAAIRADPKLAAAARTALAQVGQPSEAPDLSRPAPAARNTPHTEIAEHIGHAATDFEVALRLAAAADLADAVRQSLNERLDHALETGARLRDALAGAISDREISEFLRSQS